MQWTRKPTCASAAFPSAAGVTPELCIVAHEPLLPIKRDDDSDAEISPTNHEFSVWRTAKCQALHMIRVWGHACKWFFLWKLIGLWPITYGVLSWDLALFLHESISHISVRLYIHMFMETGPAECHYAVIPSLDFSTHLTVRHCSLIHREGKSARKHFEPKPSINGYVGP